MWTNRATVVDLCWKRMGLSTDPNVDRWIVTHVGRSCTERVLAVLDRVEVVAGGQESYSQWCVRDRDPAVSRLGL